MGLHSAGAEPLARRPDPPPDESADRRHWSASGLVRKTAEGSGLSRLTTPPLGGPYLSGLGRQPACTQVLRRRGKTTRRVTKGLKKE
jgi:hypothetical protein